MSNTSLPGLNVTIRVEGSGSSGSSGSGYTPVKGVDYWTEADIQEIHDWIDKTMEEMFDANEAMDALCEAGLIDPAADADGAVYTDADGSIFVL